MFIRLTRYCTEEPVIVNLETVRFIRRDMGSLSQTRLPGTTIAFAATTGEGHVIVVNETLEQVIAKIDEAHESFPKDLSERYHSGLAERRLRRRLAYLAGLGR